MSFRAQHPVTATAGYRVELGNAVAATSELVLPNSVFVDVLEEGGAGGGKEAAAAATARQLGEADPPPLPPSPALSPPPEGFVESLLHSLPMDSLAMKGEELQEALGDRWTDVHKWGSEHFGSLQESLAGVFEDVKSGKINSDTIKEGAATRYEALKESASNTLEGVKSTSRDLWASTQGSAATTSRDIRGIFDAASEGDSEKLSLAFEVPARQLKDAVARRVADAMPPSVGSRHVLAVPFDGARSSPRFAVFASLHTGSPARHPCPRWPGGGSSHHR